MSVWATRPKLLRCYLAKMTGYSRAQVTRLIGPYQSGRGADQSDRRNCFAARFPRADIELLAQADEAHETLSGPATQKLLARACYDFGQQEFQRLANISVARLYALRRA